MMENYGLANTKGLASIGLPRVEKIPENLLGIYFLVDDIEETLKSILKNGGAIVQKKSQITPEIGYSAKFNDCFGNSLCLFSGT